ncbi:hypothetical protein [Natrialba sp. SSL1]|uniref:hypothetical protein n=1 Tax=Natrialba sp. SSL1 TaxID=1869245 RepID=UPI0008F83E85|nr:hypothetical protein [Natrialba sp. SSL1]OIB58042.1 hypothetical protein BBD46_10265 [Natrialba sp. SSL1]
MFENSLHYNHPGEGPSVDRSSEYIDSLIIPAHFAIEHAEQVSGRVSNLEQEYYINPYLPTFREGDNFLEDSGNLKQWSHRLVDFYEDIVVSKIQEEGNLRYQDLSRENQRNVVETTVDFQLEILDEHADSTLKRYSLSDAEYDLLPKAVIPWYVKLSTEKDLEYNKQIISDTVEYTDHPVKPCIFMKRRLVTDVNFREGLANYLGDAPINEVFLWIEGLDKRESSRGHYVSTVDLVSRISDQDVAPHFFYGSYFSNLLSIFGLQGTGFGINYSESASEKLKSQDGGGGGASRYYFEPIKEFVGIAEAVQLGEDHTEPCDCRVCRDWMEGWKDIYAVADEQKRLAQHYAAIREKQQDDVEKKSLQDLLEELEERQDTFGEALGESESVATADHLEEWREGVKIYVKKVENCSITEFNP